MCDVLLVSWGGGVRPGTLRSGTKNLMKQKMSKAAEEHKKYHARVNIQLRPSLPHSSFSTYCSFIGYNYNHTFEVSKSQYDVIHLLEVSKSQYDVIHLRHILYVYAAEACGFFQ